jgi:hypothetical protein
MLVTTLLAIILVLAFVNILTLVLLRRSITLLRLREAQVWAVLATLRSLRDQWMRLLSGSAPEMPGSDGMLLPSPDEAFQPTVRRNYAMPPQDDGSWSGSTPTAPDDQPPSQ